MPDAAGRLIETAALSFQNSTAAFASAGLTRIPPPIRCKARQEKDIRHRDLYICRKVLPGRQVLRDPIVKGNCQEVSRYRSRS